ncbi:Amino-acid permease BAT1 [Striga hermonthica]|uniref:Amino-acid permease BAT1 n=1 Tax=Striga hermonthica TaxID=68872 RepID=A0A9N7NWK6_STRHE|nr:Amino-acid permease BAT1 [Striga hermonthica]
MVTPITVLGGADEAPYHLLRSSDDSRLNQLGYKQELRRSLSQGLAFGGPVTMIYGWPVVGLMTIVVGLSLSEICSAYPVSGGLYFWSAKLGGNYWGPFTSWLTGW